jgi:hypothetical protein
MNAKSRSIAAAVALLLITGTGVAEANNDVRSAQVRCGGINSCKGQSYCATAKNACAGQNACKGQGWLRVSRKECAAKGGRILPMTK